MTRCIVRVSTGRHAGFDAILAAVVGGALHDETTPPDNDDPGPRIAISKSAGRAQAVAVVDPPPHASGRCRSLRRRRRRRLGHYPQRTGCPRKFAGLLVSDGPTYCRERAFPARGTRWAIVHTGAATSAILVIAAVFGVVAWVADLIVVGVVAIVVTIVRRMSCPLGCFVDCDSLSGDLPCSVSRNRRAVGLGGPQPSCPWLSRDRGSAGFAKERICACP